jgi:hypothetical protein
MQISICPGLSFVSLVACVLLLGSCASPEPAGTSPAAAVTPPIATAAPPKQSPDHPSGRPLRITVKPGQSLGRIAEYYHVPKPAIIAANQLQPPYELKAGSQLVIPGAAANTAAVKPQPKATTAPAKAVHATKPKSPPASEPEVIPLD